MLEDLPIQLHIVDTYGVGHILIPDGPLLSILDRNSQIPGVGNSKVFYINIDIHT